MWNIASASHVLVHKTSLSTSTSLESYAECFATATGENQKINSKEFWEIYKQVIIKHPWFKEGIMNDIKKYFKINEDKTTYRNYRDAANPGLQRSRLRFDS